MEKIYMLIIKFSMYKICAILLNIYRLKSKCSSYMFNN